jgi:hypothetical protein
MHDGERDALVQQIINLAKRSLPFNEGEYEATQYVSSTSAQIGFSFDQEGYKLYFTRPGSEDYRRSGT